MRIGFLTAPRNSVAEQQFARRMTMSTVLLLNVRKHWFAPRKCVAPKKDAIREQKEVAPVAIVVAISADDRPDLR